jgi:hypothetical protein
LVEGSFFDEVPLPHRVDADLTVPGQLRAVGNRYRGPEALPQSSGNAFVPPYTYAADDASDVEARVRAGAGRQAVSGQ